MAETRPPDSARGGTATSTDAPAGAATSTDAPAGAATSTDARGGAATSTDASGPRAQNGASSPHLWVSTTYFAEGFPYAIVNNLADVLFTEMGASLKTIGLTALFHLPWNIKFLWSPFLDAFGTKREWLIRTEIVILAVLLVFAFFVSAGNVLGVASILFVLLAFLSASHDIAIDGYYLEGLDKDGQSRFVGYRATAYKLAMMLVAGPLLILIARAGGWVGLGGGEAVVFGWGAGFAVCAALMGLLLAYHTLFLPRVETARRSFRELGAFLIRPRSLTLLAITVGLSAAATWAWTRPAGVAARAELLERYPLLEKISFAEWVALTFFLLNLAVLLGLSHIKRWLSGRDSFYANAFVDFLNQRQVGLILAFVLSFRMGESFLLKMRYPFLKAAGMTQDEFGLAAGTLGVIASFSATMVGGFLISRKGGLKRWLWPFMLSQNTLNLLFAYVAWELSRLAPGGRIGLPLLTTVITVESFGAGLGTAIFMVYLMRCCRPAYKAAHMAILTAFMSLTFTLAGVVSGFLAEALGFTAYFVMTFLATVPAMILAFYVPYLDGTTAGDQVAKEGGAGAV